MKLLLLTLCLFVMFINGSAQTETTATSVENKTTTQPQPKSDLWPADIRVGNISHTISPNKIAGKRNVSSTTIRDTPIGNQNSPKDDQTQKRDAQGNIIPVNNSVTAMVIEDIPPQVVFLLDIKFELENSGEKNIKSIKWEYVLSNEEKGKVIKRFGFETKGPFPLNEKTPVHHIKRLNEELKLPTNTSKEVVILEIKYEDGSKWTRPK